MKPLPLLAVLLLAGCGGSAASIITVTTTADTSVRSKSEPGMYLVSLDGTRRVLAAAQ